MEGESSKQMSFPPEETGGTFTCYKCGLKEHYDYKGKKPPFAKLIAFHEESYVMHDPFTPSRHEFLLLGSDCSVCSKSVCQSPSCSIFYLKRFCQPCAEYSLDRFPQPVQAKIKKKMSVSGQ